MRLYRGGGGGGGINNRTAMDCFIFGHVRHINVKQEIVFYAHVAIKVAIVSNIHPENS